MGEFKNARKSRHQPLPYDQMTERQKAYADMMYAKQFGGPRYRDARKHYERIVRKEQRLKK